MRFWCVCVRGWSGKVCVANVRRTYQLAATRVVEVCTGRRAAEVQLAQKIVTVITIDTVAPRNEWLL